MKELIWTVQRDDFVEDKDYFNFTTETSNLNPVSTAKLQLNGHDRFAERPGEYFSLVQPYQHHENVPLSSSGKDLGINVYSFGLKPEEHQPKTYHWAKKYHPLRNACAKKKEILVRCVNTLQQD